MSLTQLTNKLKKKYLYKQVLRFYPESEDFSIPTLSKYYLSWRDENQLPYYCENTRCLLHRENPRWNGKKITLEINHIDASERNWRPKNLKLLCPNCHNQTGSTNV